MNTQINNQTDPNLTTTHEPIPTVESNTVFTAPVAGPVSAPTRNRFRLMAASGLAGLFVIGGAIGLATTGGSATTSETDIALTQAADSVDSELVGAEVLVADPVSPAGNSTDSNAAVVPADGSPTEEAPAEEAPVAEAPAEEAPTEEAPVEETPADTTGDNPFDFGFGIELPTGSLFDNLTDPELSNNLPDFELVQGLVFMPDVINMNRTQAAILLSDLGLNVTIREVIVFSGENNTVRSASIEAGTLVTEGQAVTLEVIKNMNPFD